MGPDDNLFTTVLENIAMTGAPASLKSSAVPPTPHPGQWLIVEGGTLRWAQAGKRKLSQRLQQRGFHMRFAYTNVGGLKEGEGSFTEVIQK